MRPHDPLAACIHRAATQHGVVAKTQAVSLGLSVDAIKRLIARRAWRPLHPGVYAFWAPRTRVDRWRQRMAAGSLWLGAGSAASNRGAAAVWTLLDPGPLEFSTTGRRRSTELLVHRVKALPSEDVVLRDGIRVTTVARTLVDLTAVVEPRTLEVAFEAALRMRLATRAAIAAALDEATASHPGKRSMRSLLDRSEPTTESVLEDHVWHFVRRHHLPKPVRQHGVREKGQFVARVDFAYPEARVAIEADGFAFHSSRRDWRRHLGRQNALLRIGWVVYRITWEDVLHDEDRVAADIRALLVSRSSRSAQP